jgi:hydroxymethylpyrimidine pyrophosphatase-like HAD family hydrolase
MNDTLPRLADAPFVPLSLTSAEVLYTDLDGTLLGRGGSLLTDGEGRPDASAARAVAMVNAAGLPVVMVSGRNVKQLLELARLLGWRDYIAEVGTVRVHDRGAELHYELGDWTPGLAEETDETPYEIIARTGAVDALFAAFPGRLEYHTPYHLDRLVTHALRGQVDLVAAQGILDSYALPLAIVDNGVIHPMRHSLAGVTRIHAYHVMPAGVTKVHAIEADLEERGLARDQAMAIGDSATDLAMAPAVGLLALVRNALDQPDLAAAAAGVEHLVVTAEPAGRGWAELAHAWISAREGRECGKG